MGALRPSFPRCLPTPPRVPPRGRSTVVPSGPGAGQVREVPAVPLRRVADWPGRLAVAVVGWGGRGRRSIRGPIVTRLQAGSCAARAPARFESHSTAALVPAPGLPGQAPGGWYVADGADRRAWRVGPSTAHAGPPNGPLLGCRASVATAPARIPRRRRATRSPLPRAPHEMLRLRSAVRGRPALPSA